MYNEVERVIVSDDSPNQNTKNYEKGTFDNKVLIYSVVNDREGPEIKSIVFSTDTLKGNDSLGITVTVVDNMAKAEFIDMRFNSPDGGEFYIFSNEWILSNDSTFKTFVSIDNFNNNDGVYKIDIINVSDDSPNKNTRNYGENEFDNTVVVSRNITGISSNKEDNFTFYPNPTHSTLTINSKNNVSNEIQIIDQYGEIVKSVEVNSLEATTIDVSGIQPGVFFLKQGQQSSKFVIQK